MPEESKMRRQVRFELLTQALFTAPCLLQKLFFALLELFARAQCRDILFERGEESLHGFLESCALAGRQGEQAWTLRMFEGEHIAQIRRRCATCLAGGQQLLHGSQSTSARHATDVDIVTGADYFYAQFERLLGALLANDAIERGQVSSGGEWE